MPKRPASTSSPSRPVKKSRTASPASSVSSDVAEGGDAAGSGKWRDWPAPRDQMDAAKEFIRECVEGRHRVVICPDKDADGLSSGVILSLTLRRLSLPASHTAIYHLPISINVHHPTALSQILQLFPSSGGPTRVIVLDQGSRPGPPIIPSSSSSIKTLIIDHHLITSFPESTQMLTACQSLPVATTSILTYHLCSELVPSLRGSTLAGLPALLGAYGDLGSGKLKYDNDPWPASLAAVEKRLTKSALGKAVSMLNAPRRTPQFDVKAAYGALWEAAVGKGERMDGDGEGEGLKRILKDGKLNEARERTSAEVTRWQGAPPVFTKDGRIAVVTVTSQYQIHPVIATRWTGTLKNAKTLVCVMCANPGYTPGYVHFSCRSPRRSSSDPPDLIAFLRSLIPLADAISPGWSSRVGEDFARGHREATGGIIKKEEFDVLMQAVELGVKKEKEVKVKEGKGGAIDKSMKKGALDGFFKADKSDKKENVGAKAA